MSEKIKVKNFPERFRDPIKALQKLKRASGDELERQGEKMAIELFHEMSKRVPAYKDFLKKKKINPKVIKTIEDFKKIPTISKDNYLKKYSLSDLCWDGKFFEKQWTIASTSGSTGEPFYFPHEHLQGWHYALLAELYLRTNFNIHKKSTLYVNAFPMGVWIGGVFTYEAINLLSRRGDYRLSIINPGISKKGVIKAIEKLNPYFDQIILGGYGPFVKDIIDDGELHGVNWKRINLKFVFSAESFTEEFRDYIFNAVGTKNIYTDSLNHYGTVDLGTMSYETPISILVRRESVKDRGLYDQLFGNETRLPTLTQYIPELFFFEVDGKKLYCSARSGLPLTRYDLKDNGGIISYEKLEKVVAKNKPSIGSLIKESKIEDTVWKLPFVYVYERQDFSVSLYAFQIYPETIRRAFLDKTLNKYLTSKFTMSVEYTTEMSQQLIIKVELRNGIKKSTYLEKKVGKKALNLLLKENSEYRETYKEKGVKINPKIKLFLYEDSRYFAPGIKQKWVKTKN